MLRLHKSVVSFAIFVMVTMFSFSTSNISVASPIPVRTPLSQLILSPKQLRTLGSGWSIEHRDYAGLEGIVRDLFGRMGSLDFTPASCTIPMDIGTLLFAQQVYNSAEKKLISNEAQQKNITIALVPDSESVENLLPGFIAQANSCPNVTVAQKHSSHDVTVHAHAIIQPITAPKVLGAHKIYGYHFILDATFNDKIRHNLAANGQHHIVGSGYGALIRNIWVIVAESGKNGDTSELLSVFNKQTQQIQRAQ